MAKSSTKINTIWIVIETSGLYPSKVVMHPGVYADLTSAEEAAKNLGARPKSGIFTPTAFYSELFVDAARQTSYDEGRRNTINDYACEFGDECACV